MKQDSNRHIQAYASDLKKNCKKIKYSAERKVLGEIQFTSQAITMATIFRQVGSNIDKE